MRIVMDEDLRNAVKDWLDQLETQLCYTDNTIINYRRDVKDFLYFMSDFVDSVIGLDDIKSYGPEGFRAWLSDRIGRNLSSRTNARALSAVKSFYAYLAKKNFLENKAIGTIRRAKLEKLLPKPIPADNLMEFLDKEFYFENDPQWITDRDRALYTLLYSTGLRINEALNIKTKDVDLEIKIKGKGKKDRIVLLFPITIERINTYIASCPYDLTDNFLFLGLRGKKLLASTVDIRLKKLQILNELPERASAHAFRHSFATHLVQRGADLRSVQELLGHESLESTQVYTDIDSYNLLRIYENSHPLELGDKDKKQDHNIDSKKKQISSYDGEDDNEQCEKESLSDIDQDLDFVS